MKKPVRYPGGAKRSSGHKPSQQPKQRSYANRGKELEAYIELSNEMYMQRNRAVVFRQHPEVTVVRKGKQIVSAFYKAKSGLDYIGLKDGRGFTFDTKETKNSTSFPMDNVEGHQVLSMQRWTDQGGFAFLMVRFVKHHEIYVLTYEQLKDWWQGYTGDGRKSIPYEWFTLNCEIVTAGAGVAIDYLPVLDKFMRNKGM